MIPSGDRLTGRRNEPVYFDLASSSISIKASPFLAIEGFSFAIVATDKSQSVAMANASSYFFTLSDRLLSVKITKRNKKEVAVF